MSEANVEDLQAIVEDLKAKNRDLSEKLKAASGSLKDADTLKGERDRLAAQVISLNETLEAKNGEVGRRRHETRAAEKERDDLAAAMEALKGERDTLKTRIESEPNEYKAKVDELTGQLRSIKHDVAYRNVLKTLKVSDPAKQADLLKLAEYKPEADEPDETKIIEVFGSALKGRPWLVDAEPAATTTAAPTTTTTAAPASRANGATTTPAVATGKPGPGSDRGQSLSQSTTQVSQRDGRI
jgi:hypothetical protein